MEKWQPPFIINGEQISAPQKLADVQLWAFKNKIEKLMQNLPTLKGDPLVLLKNALQKWGMFADRRPKFIFKNITPKKNAGIHLKMGNSTSHGNDQIDALSIISVPDLLAEPLCFITNLSMNTATFANKWKVAQIIPLHKGKGLTIYSPDSYCPVSLLPTMAKLIE